MNEYIRRITTPLTLSLALVAGACAKSDNPQLATDTSALNRDIQLANRTDSTAPALNDVPAPAPAPAPVSTPTPRAPAPAPRRTTSSTTPAPRPTTTTTTPRPTTTASGNTVTNNSTGGNASSVGGGAVGTIPSGTTIALNSNDRVCTNTYKVGQQFTATVSEAVTGSNGASIPAGSTARMEVTSLKRSENANDNIEVGFRVVSLTVNGRSYPVDATVASAKVDKVRNQPKGKDIQKVIGGAVIGAVIGQAVGKDTKGTVIGAAGGAAAGTAAAAATANYEGCIPDGGRITITLTNGAQIRV